MADEIQGALSQAQVAPPAPEQQAPLSTQNMLSDYFQKIKVQEDAATKSLNERRQRLLELTSSRKQMFDPKMLRLSAAFGRPTKTGSFGESLGYASEAMADEQEKELLRKQQELKLQMEIEQMMQQQSSQSLGRELAANIFAKSQPQSGAPAPVAPTPVASAPAAPAVSVAPANQAAPAMPAPVVSNAPPAVSVGLPPRKKGMFDSLNDEDLFALNLADPNMGKLIGGAREESRKGRETEIKEADIGLKGQVIEGVVPGVGDKKMPIDFWNQLRNSQSMDEIKSLYSKYRLPWEVIKEKDGTLRFKTPNEIELEKEEAKAKLSEKIGNYPIPAFGPGLFPMLDSEYRAYRKAQSEGGDALQEWANKYFPEKSHLIAGAKKVKPVQSSGVVESVGDREAREAREKKIAEQRAISEVKNRDEIVNRARVAEEMEIPARTINDLAKDPVAKKALGLLENPTVRDAFLGVIANGAQIGSYNVGVPEIRSAVSKLSGNNTKEAEKINDALQTFASNFAELELGATKQYLSGQGAITEGERVIVRNINGSVASRPNVILAKSELLLQKAAFDKKVNDLYLNWEEKNPSKPFDYFKQSNEYKQLRNQLNLNAMAINKKYFGEQNTSRSPAQNQPAEGRLLPAESSVNTRVFSQTGQRTK